ncbi:hypothetical protein YB2330_004089 [Saitoella coloradoensis]
MFTSASAIANPTTFKAEDYEELELIGRGSFGLIRKVRRKSDGRIFARKEIDWRLMSDAEKHQLVAEVNILDQIRHPNIVRYYSREVKRDACLIYLYMEYCGGGDLGRFLEGALHECHNPPSITAATRGREARKTILHRDLKPENIFLSTPTSSSTPVASLGSAAIAPTPKLGDFGLSKSLDDAHALARTYVGTPYYMSPELINSQPYSAKSDIWALGCVLYEICSLKPPFNGKNHRELGIAIESGRFDVNGLSGYGTAITEVIAACLQLNPLARPTTQDLLTHPMIRAGLSSRAMKTRELAILEKEQDLLQREVQIGVKEKRLTEAYADMQRKVHESERVCHELRAALVAAQQEISQLRQATTTSTVVNDSGRPSSAPAQRVEEPKRPPLTLLPAASNIESTTPLTSDVAIPTLSTLNKPLSVPTTTATTLAAPPEVLAPPAAAAATGQAPSTPSRVGLISAYTSRASSPTRRRESGLTGSPARLNSKPTIPGLANDLRRIALNGKAKPGKPTPVGMEAPNWGEEGGDMPSPFIRRIAAEGAGMGLGGGARRVRVSDIGSVPVMGMGVESGSAPASDGTVAKSESGIEGLGGEPLISI